MPPAPEQREAAAPCSAAVSPYPNGGLIMKPLRPIHVSIVAALCLLLPLISIAQGPGGPPATPPGQGQGPGQSPGSGPPPTATPDPAKVIISVTGVISGVYAEYGAEYPAILFTPDSASAITVRLCPLWFMEDEVGLSLETLVSLKDSRAFLVALKKTTDEEVVYHAITLTLLPDGPIYRFRTDDGKPLWNGSAKKPKDRTTASVNVVQGSARDLSGSIVRSFLELKTGELYLLLLGDDGYTYNLRLGAPEEILATDLPLRERTRLKVRFALETASHNCVALQLSTEAQLRIRLRDENGASFGPN